MSKIKLAILGCSGRTGSKILSHGLLDDRIEIVGGLVSKNSRFLGNDLSVIVDHDKKTGILATSDLSLAIQNADVIIDFSSKEITNELIDNANEFLKNRKLIIGVTGFDEDFNEKLLNVSNNHVIFKSSNMSIGIGLICEFLKRYSRVLNDEYEIIINDIHHKNKKDSPSGTALMLKHSLEISNNAQNIQINSSRISDIKGIHEIMMIDECETISIRHDVSDRKIFAVNSLKIAHWIHKISRNGLYHMNDFLEFGAEV